MLREEREDICTVLFIPLLFFILLMTINWYKAKQQKKDNPTRTTPEKIGNDLNVDPDKIKKSIDRERKRRAKKKLVKKKKTVKKRTVWINVEISKHTHKRLNDLRQEEKDGKKEPLGQVIDRLVK